jgi:uncharacterized protein HemX
MDITAVLALAVLVGLVVGLAAYVTVFQKQQPQQQQRASPDEDDEPVQVEYQQQQQLHELDRLAVPAAADVIADACRTSANMRL